jgi:polar amino acid transport system substrate-binding protein
MRLAVLGLLLLLALFPAMAVAAGMSPALPYFADPSGRETAPESGAVPSIRFLTTADFPPFNYRDKSGALVGFNVDLARGICTELKIGCTIQAWPWDQAGRALADNQGDALIAGLAVTPQNGAQFDFSDVYFGLPGRFVTRTAGVAGFTPQALAGKTVAVREGTTHAEFVARYLPASKRLTFATEPQALAAVAGGQADAYFGDALRASFWLNEHPGCCAFAGDPYFRPDLFGNGLAIAVPPGRDAIRQALNYALLHLKQVGKLDELYLRWFPVGFY